MNKKFKEKTKSNREKINDLKKHEMKKQLSKN